jgi:hypothetical protein
MMVQKNFSWFPKGIFMRKIDKNFINASVNFSICESLLPIMKIKLPAFKQGTTPQKRQTFCILKRPNG